MLLFLESYVLLLLDIWRTSFNMNRKYKILQENLNFITSRQDDKQKIKPIQSAKLSFQSADHKIYVSPPDDDRIVTYYDRSKYTRH
jgi:hypothetical protein